MKQRTYLVTINAPVPQVWETMLAPDTYTEWTEAFSPGCYYEGSWDEGAEIRFLAPGGDGMISEIAENRRHELVSIRHRGVILKGVVDTESDAVKAWDGAYEKYLFMPVDGGTEVKVLLDVMPEYEAMMDEMFPKALAKLKEICEAP